MTSIIKEDVTSTLVLPFRWKIVEVISYLFCVFFYLYYWIVWLQGKEKEIFPPYFSWFLVIAINQFILKGQYLLYSMKDFWTNEEVNFLLRISAVPIHRFINFYHKYELHEIERVREIKGSRLLLGYHTRNTFDLVYMVASLKPTVLVSYLMFKVPVFNHLLPLVGLMPSKVDGDQTNEGSFVAALTNSRKPVMLLPGGVPECLKPYSEQYRLSWKEKPGYARVIHENQHLFKDGISVIPFYTKNSEKLLFTTRTWYDCSGKTSQDLYERFKKGDYIIVSYMLTMMVLSLGVALFPIPLKLDTYFGQAITLKKDESVEQFSRRVSNHLQEIIEIVNNHNESMIIKQKIHELDINDSSRVLLKRTKEEQINYINKINQYNFPNDFKHLYNHNFGYYFYFFTMSVYTIMQNLFFYCFFTPILWALFPPLALVYVIDSIRCLLGFGRKKTKSKGKIADVSISKVD